MADLQRNAFSEDTLTPIFQRLGRFADGSDRMVRLPAYVVKIDGDNYFMPAGIDILNGFDTSLKATLDTEGLDEAQWQADFGFETGKRIVVDPGQLGDERDSFLGLNRVGLI